MAASGGAYSCETAARTREWMDAFAAFVRRHRQLLEDHVVNFFKDRLREMVLLGRAGGRRWSFAASSSSSWSPQPSSGCSLPPLLAWKMRSEMSDGAQGPAQVALDADELLTLLDMFLASSVLDLLHFSDRPSVLSYSAFL